MDLQARNRVTGLIHPRRVAPPVLPPWFLIALGEVGECEIPGKDWNPRIVEYLATVNLDPCDEIPWCSGFVNWCVIQAGLQGTNSGMARSWLNWGVSIPTPRLGAIVVLRRGNAPWQGHVGMWIGEGLILGGNQGNRVCVAPYNDEPLDYRWAA